MELYRDQPYGTERCYNGLRLAHALRKQDPDVRLTIFLMGGDNRVLVCGTCMAARGMADGEGAERSDMPTLAAATLEADKVLVF
ncbi:MAG: hypothetical protein VR70_14700 [Rhodospirillaceae bacterium BRH_c57]|nr:MAG: hypothetical protein VR70_14700 [Rhodospirillaceae bacterium BRH_c57]